MKIQYIITIILNTNINFHQQREAKLNNINQTLILILGKKTTEN